MFCKFLLATLLGLSAISASAVETIAIDYQYSGEHGVDFSSMPSGPLRIAEFGDARPVDNARLITENGLGDGENQGGFQAKQAVSDLLRSALVQGFEAGDASLVDSGENLMLAGDVTEVSSELKNGEIEVTVKAKVQLKNSQSGSELFATTLFGRASAPRGPDPQEDGLAAALAGSLDSLVNSLLWDDYFLMQVID